MSMSLLYRLEADLQRLRVIGFLPPDFVLNPNNIHISCRKTWLNY